jgi:serine/threonine-protein kinase
MPDALTRLAEALSDRYGIERELGQGGMATVYLARDLKHDREVAIKVLRPELGTALGAERFLTEIRITARLDHPHILTLIDSGAVDGTLYYVMPLVRGESLRVRLVRERQLGLEAALDIARQVASALDYAHRQGVVHRDIKPENILLHEGEAILTDFGIALAVIEASGDRLTGTGLSIGTPSYMSPEQAAGDRDLDPRSDIYALGALTYEMLAGEPPVSGATAHAVIAKLMTERPTSLRVLRPTVPPAVDAAVMRALAKAPGDRFATTRDFAEALSGTLVKPRASTTLKRRTVGIATGIAALAGILLVARARWPSGTSSGTSAAAPQVIRSIAVLPLDNYSADSTQAYFAEGMTDELTTDLATISSLRVTSRGSTLQFAGKNRPPTPTIAKTLNVDAIVEGSVTRSGDKVRITAQLIDARADRHLWAHSFERQSSDLLALQAELASAIAEAINAELTPREKARMAAAPTMNPAAYDAYLKGRFFFNRPTDDNLRKAIAQFTDAVRLHPGFVAAYSGLADAYIWAAYNETIITASEAKPKIKAAAETAVQLDSNSAEAHTSLGVYRSWFERDWEGGLQEFRRAIALSPNYAFAHDQLGQELAILGRFAEANAEGKLALALDPLSPSILVDVGITFVFQRQAVAVKEIVRKTAELDPTYFAAPQVDAWLDFQLGGYRDAVPKLERARTMGAPPFITAFLGYAYGKSGARGRALSTLEELKRMSPGREAAPFNLGLVYLGLGDRNRAIDYFERAYAANSEFLVWLKVDRVYEPLRGDPRFIALMKKMNFAP